MALAETAKLAVDLTLGGNFTGGMSQAESAAARFNATAAASGTHAGTVSTAFGRIGSAAGKVGGALEHAGSQIKNLVTGPLGLLGLGAGLFSLAGGIEKGISKAGEFAFAIEKMQGLTNDSADSLARLIAVTDNYGISADRLTKIIGFTEKSLGNIATTAGGAANFAKQFGFSITDAQGKVLPFNDILLKAADFYNSTAAQSTKAALAAKLFGRSYADLVPILKLGSKGIADAEQAAADLGITLNKTNVEDLAKYREATRSLGDAVSGLELQIGLALVPSITDAANAIRTFISGHRTDIVAFFKNATQAAKNVAGVIGDLAGTFGRFWSSIPEGVRDLLVKGFVADRTVKFLFGFDPVATLGKSLLGGLGGSILSRGGSPANPMWVQQVGGIPGANGGGGLPMVIPLAVLAAGIVEAVRETMADRNNPAIFQQTVGPNRTIPAQFGPRTAAQAANVQQVLHLDNSIPNALEDVRHAIVTHLSTTNADLEKLRQSTLARQSATAAAIVAKQAKTNNDLETLRQGMLSRQSVANSRLAEIARKKTAIRIVIPISITSRNSVYRISATGRTVADGMTNSTSGRGIVTI